MPSTIRIVIHSWMGLPLIARDKIHRLPGIESDSQTPFDESQVRLAMAIANQARPPSKTPRIIPGHPEYTRKWPHYTAASQELARIQEDIEQVYNSIHQAAGETRARQKIFTISLLDEKRGQIDGVYLYDRARPQPSSLPARCRVFRQGHSERHPD